MLKIKKTLQAVAAKADTWSPAAILAVACLLVLAARIVAFKVPAGPAPSNEWDHVAANLAEGRGYVSSWPKTYIQPDVLGIDGDTLPYAPTAVRPPVPVFYFALIFRLFGVGFPLPLVIGQWLLDVLTAIVLFFLAMEIFSDKRVAILTVLAWAFYVPALWMANSRNPEPLTALLLASLVYTLLVAIRTRTLWRFVLVGVLWGLNMLSRSATALLPVFLLPIVIWQLRHKLVFAFSACAIVVLIGVLVLAPWIYRNHVVFDAFVPLSTLGGYSLFRDHYLIDQDDYLHYRTADKVDLAMKEMLDRRYGSAAEVERDPTITRPMLEDVYKEEAVSKIKQYPGRYVILSLVRLGRLWFNVGPGGRPSVASLIIVAVHLALMGLGAVALLFYRGDWVPKMLPAFALLVHHTLVYAAMVAEFRYSIPLVPYLFVLACYALVRLVVPRPEA